MNDCISKQAVNTLVDELARAISDERCCISRGRSTATIMRDILHLPPVKPQEQRWISVSEKYPPVEEQYNEFLTVDDSGRMSVQRFYLTISNDPQPYFSGVINVIAWMPLPKPYEPQESEDENDKS